MKDAGIIVACGVINQIQYPEYAKAAWKYEADDSEVMVLHTLVVDPDQSKKGFGKTFVTLQYMINRPIVVCSLS